VTVIEVDGFREPFIGYLPGLTAAAGDLGSSPWGSGIHAYTELPRSTVVSAHRQR
jgi:hypothetical protein